VRILFITLSNINSVNEIGIYQDLLREFLSNGHKLDVMSPIERRHNKKTHIINENDCNIVKVKTLNTQKTNFFEKTISLLVLNTLFTSAYFSFLSKNKYDIILLSTPPITLNGFVKKIKIINSAFTYLLLKDIFPQNAVDLNLIKSGSLTHQFFKSKEDRLYSISDKIGCMSPANRDYLIDNNHINKDKIEINANSVNLDRLSNIQQNNKLKIRQKYKIPMHSTCILFGGNLGKPQGIPNLIRAIDSCKKIENIFFIIVGEGTYYKTLLSWVSRSQIENVKVINYLPRLEYLNLVNCIDVGLISLDFRFTIPNFPSRLLSYLEMKKPVLIYTDRASDMGRIAEHNNFGFFAASDSTAEFLSAIKKIKINCEFLSQMGNNGYNFMLNNYTTAIAYEKIIEAKKAFEI
jgi:glycosyltransferase involved in cell wall biosynthesis